MPISKDLEPIVEHLLVDLSFAAEVGKDPDVVDAVMSDRRVREACGRDSVLFAVLLLGQSWLVDAKAPVHVKFLKDESGRIVVVCGRGWGKSLMSAVKGIVDMFQYAPVEIVIVSSSQRQSMQIFGYLTSMMHRTQTLRRTIKRETRTMISTKPPFMSTVWALPCSLNKLRGKHPDELIVDEASIVPDKMLSTELLLMLTKKYQPEDLKQYPDWPKLRLTGTPFASEHMFKRSFDNPKFSKYHEPSYNSPLVNATMLEEWRAIMTEDEWRREVEAQWVDMENAYFTTKLISDCVDPNLELVEDGVNGEIAQDIPFWVNRYGANFGGLDLGKERTYSALSIVNYQGDRGIQHVYSRLWPLKTPYATVEAETVEAGKRFGLGTLVVDSTGVGDRVVEEFTRMGAGWSLEPLFLTEPVKEDVFSGVKLAMEKGKVKITDYKRLITEMSEQTYEYMRPKQPEDRLHIKFQKPAGHFDDVLISFLLASWGALKTGDWRPFVGGARHK